MEKPLAEAIGQLATRLEKAGLPTLARLVFSVVGDRSRSDHERWDDETRGKLQDGIIEVLAAGVHGQPAVDQELPVERLKTVQEAPALDAGVIDGPNTEVEALEATGVVKRDGRRLLVSNPGRLLSGLVALASDKTIWVAAGTRRGVRHLWEATISPVQARLHPAVQRDSLLRLSCHASRVYGVSVVAVSAAEIYRGAPEFVERAGAGTALTFSTSSGVIDPLERFGTEEVLSRLGLPSDYPLKRKDEWRVVNFADGLLNPSFGSRRPYFFDKKTTKKALSDTLASLPADRRESYKRLAAELLVGALECPRFELYSVAEFQPWMWRYTRSAPGHALISFRHPDTTSITDGLELNFRDPKKARRWFDLVFNAIRIGTPFGLRDPVSAGAFCLLVTLAGQVERAFYEHVTEDVLRSRAEADVLAHSTRVRLKSSTREAQLEEGYGLVEQLAQ